MYAGQVVEELAARDLRDAQHPYTQGLMRCLPTLEDDVRPLPTLNRDPAWALLDAGDDPEPPRRLRRRRACRSMPSRA